MNEKGNFYFSFLVLWEFNFLRVVYFFIFFGNDKIIMVCKSDLFMLIKRFYFFILVIFV